MRFRFIEAEKVAFPVSVLCEVMEVSRSGYYAWVAREPSKRSTENSLITVSIKTIFKQSRETYGSPRVHAELESRGIGVGLNRVARLMRDSGVAVMPKRGYRVSTTRSDPKHPTQKNTLNREFEASGPNEKWVTDVTYVPTEEGWLYLAAMLDLYNREVVGWAVSDCNDTELTIRALDSALESHEPPEGLLHHSDRGSNYTSFQYQTELKNHGIECSMSRRADCWDNAVCESFFATLKKELLHRFRYTTRREAAAAIFEYIELFYNRIRKHSTLGFVAPVEYRQLGLNVAN